MASGDSATRIAPKWPSDNHQLFKISNISVPETQTRKKRKRLVKPATKRRDSTAKSHLTERDPAMNKIVERSLRRLSVSSNRSAVTKFKSPVNRTRIRLTNMKSPR